MSTPLLYDTFLPVYKGKTMQRQSPYALERVRSINGYVRYDLIVESKASDQNYSHPLNDRDQIRVVNSFLTITDNMKARNTARFFNRHLTEISYTGEQLIHHFSRLSPPWAPNESLDIKLNRLERNLHEKITELGDGSSNSIRHLLNVDHKVDELQEMPADQLRSLRDNIVKITQHKIKNCLPVSYRYCSDQPCCYPYPRENKCFWVCQSPATWGPGCSAACCCSATCLHGTVVFIEEACCDSFSLAPPCINGLFSCNWTLAGKLTAFISTGIGAALGCAYGTWCCYYNGSKVIEEDASNALKLINFLLRLHEVKYAKSKLEPYTDHFSKR